MAKDLSIIKNLYIRSEMVDYIKWFIGKPYIWGGDDPVKGFDCSGLIHEVLQAHGLEKRGFDSTAHDLYCKLLNQGLPKLATGYPGCLVFWFKNGKAVHVAMLIGNEFICHAGGGGSSTTSVDEAAKQNAYIRKDEIGYRGLGAVYVIIDPILKEGENDVD